MVAPTMSSTSSVTTKLKLSQHCDPTDTSISVLKCAIPENEEPSAHCSIQLDEEETFSVSAAATSQRKKRNMDGHPESGFLLVSRIC